MSVDHTYPVHDEFEHVTEGLECWCAPDLLTLCGQCDGHGAAHKGKGRVCPYCDGHGWIKATIAQDVQHVMHRRVFTLPDGERTANDVPLEPPWAERRRGRRVQVKPLHRES